MSRKAEWRLFLSAEAALFVLFLVNMAGGLG